MVWVLLLAFCRESAAADKAGTFDREKQNLQQLSEYIYGDELEQRLVPVYLLGSVQRPGIYHVPPNTSLVTLLSIAGGSGENSALSEVTIKNEKAGKVETVNFQDLVSSAGKGPLLKGEDVVFIPTEKPAVSNNTMLTLTVVATLLTATLTGILIKKEL